MVKHHWKGSSSSWSRKEPSNTITKIVAIVFAAIVSKKRKIGIMEVCTTKNFGTPNPRGLLSVGWGTPRKGLMQGVGCPKLGQP